MFEESSLFDNPSYFYFDTFGAFETMYDTNFQFQQQFNDQILIGNDLDDFDDWLRWDMASRSWGGEVYDKLLSGQAYDVGDYIIVHTQGDEGYLIKIIHGGILRDDFEIVRAIRILKIEAHQNGGMSVTVGSGGLGITVQTESGASITYQ